MSLAPHKELVQKAETSGGTTRDPRKEKVTSRTSIEVSDERGHKYAKFISVQHSPRPTRFESVPSSLKIEKTPQKDGGSTLQTISDTQDNAVKLKKVRKTRVKKQKPERHDFVFTDSQETPFARHLQKVVKTTSIRTDKKFKTFFNSFDKSGSLYLTV